MATPVTQFFEFDITGTDPSGSRHIKTHGSWSKTLNTAASGALDFGSISVDSSTESDTKVVLFRADNMKGNTLIDNMRFWAPALPNPIGSLSYNAKIQTEWHRNAEMTSVGSPPLNGPSGTVSATLPLSQNLLRSKGDPTVAHGYKNEYTAISGITDDEVSQWIYLNITTNTDVTPGKYGAGGDGDFTYRVTFDYS